MSHVLVNEAERRIHSGGRRGGKMMRQILRRLRRLHERNGLKKVNVGVPGNRDARKSMLEYVVVLKKANRHISSLLTTQNTAQSFKTRQSRRSPGARTSLEEPPCL